jgi:hypothetical protein
VTKVYRLNCKISKGKDITDPGRESFVKVKIPQARNSQLFYNPKVHCHFTRSHYWTITVFIPLSLAKKKRSDV